MQINFRDFQTDVIKASHQTPVLVDFWAPWCGPCRYLSPVLEKLAESAGDKWHLVKINTDEHPDIAQTYQIRGIPAVKLFSGGKVIAEFTGALSELQVKAWLDKNLPTPSGKALEAAKQYLEKGKQAKAKKLLEQVIAEDESNAEARVLLAKLLLPADPDAAAKMVENIEPGSDVYDLASAILTFQHLFQVAAGRDKQPEWQGSPAGELYLKGIDAFRENNFAEALQAWIEVVKKDRTLDNNGAQKACVALFNWLGQDHELTREYRKKLASVLF